MNQELQALLVVQDDDAEIRAVEARLAELTPRLATLDAAVRRVRDEAARLAAAHARDAQKLRELDGRIVEHRERHAKNVAILERSQKIKEATAAAAQVEAARKLLADEESEQLSATRRLADLAAAHAAHVEQVAQLEAQQAALRASLATERAAIEAELTALRERRAQSARGVGATLLSRYDRLATRRRAAALFAINEDFSCGACDTALPLQRRPAMSGGTMVEPCEACGVLLYRRMAQ